MNHLRWQIAISVCVIFGVALWLQNKSTAKLPYTPLSIATVVEPMPGGGSPAARDQAFSGFAKDEMVSLLGGATDATPEETARARAVRNRRDEELTLTVLREALADSPWQFIDAPGEQLPVVPTQDGDGRVYIRFNRLKLDLLQPGDKLTFALPQVDHDYTMVVSEVFEHGHGIASWSGHIVGMPEEYPVSFTQGPDYTRAGIATPAGYFALEAYGGSGWILPPAALAIRAAPAPAPSGQLDGD